MQMTKDEIEQAARRMCIAEGVDPDHMCVGLGRRIPLGQDMPAWKVRIPYVLAVLDIEEPS